MGVFFRRTVDFFCGASHYSTIYLEGRSEFPFSPGKEEQEPLDGAAGGTNLPSQGKGMSHNFFLMV